jgi:hypothetical protein
LLRALNPRVPASNHPRGDDRGPMSRRGGLAPDAVAPRALGRNAEVSLNSIALFQVMPCAEQLDVFLSN